MMTSSPNDWLREVYCILGVPIDAVEMAGVLECIEVAAARSAPFLISTPNLNFLVNSQFDSEFRESLLLSDLCPPDGMPIIWIARLLGIPIKRRVAGADILEALKLTSNRREPLKIFLFGATGEVAGAAAKRLNASSAGLFCVGWACPGLINVDEFSGDRYIDQINASSANFLVAALGARNGQLWLSRNHERLSVPVRAHLGAAVNFQAGTVKRAPEPIRKLGLEWLWRIKEEPHLFRRYWRDGRVLIRLLLTRVLPLSIDAIWRRLRPKHGEHDLVTVHISGELETTLRISGDATAVQVPQAIEPFRQAADRGNVTNVDLSRTRSVDPRFFGMLLVLRKNLKNRGGELRFINVSPRLRRQFRLNGLEFLLSSGDTSDVHVVA
jgi:N-acetylglucosaminyldiphosphoundecaprenol N-acetyl-beta-D-mannosaminyltransferase